MCVYREAINFRPHLISDAIILRMSNSDKLNFCSSKDQPENGQLSLILLDTAITKIEAKIKSISNMGSILARL